MDLEELCRNLGLDETLRPFKSQSTFYEDDDGVTYIAQVDLSGHGDTLKAYIQASSGEGRPVQHFYMHAKPQSSGYRVTDIRIPAVNGDITSVSDWENQACRYFKACVGDMDYGEAPDFERYARRYFREAVTKSSGRGSGSRQGKLKKDLQSKKSPPKMKGGM
jgi:hypothetical protein